MNNRLDMELFCRQKRKPVFKVKSHLITKYTYSSGACSVFFFSSGFHYMIKKIKILPHSSYLDLLFGRNFCCPSSTRSEMNFHLISRLYIGFQMFIILCIPVGINSVLKYIHRVFSDWEK